MEIEMKIRGLMMDPSANTPIIILKDVNGESLLPIWVGAFEANAIATEIEKLSSQRPMTHDLLKNVIWGLGAAIRRIVITDLQHNTFFAVIEMLREDQLITVDARPSDAIALALRAEVEILGSDAVLDAAGIEIPDEQEDEVERFREFLDTITPEDFADRKSVV